MRSALWWLAIGLAGCGGSTGVRAASRGDLAGVSAYVAPLHKQGRLSEDEAQALAKATLERELGTAKGDDALARVREVRGCVLASEGALERLARSRDDVGAAAAYVLVDAGRMSASDARAHLADASDAWRAVGARGLSRLEDGPARRQAMTDGASVVRRAAMRAAAEARDPADLPVLAESARLDPDLSARGDAVRAIARLDVTTEEASNALSDLWPRADEALREDLAAAWAGPAVVAHGGARALELLVAQGHGPGVIAGAAAILRAGEKGPWSPEARSGAKALLRRSIASGDRRDRAFALAVAPTDDAELLEAIRKVSADESDTDARLSALARLLDVPSDRAAAITALEALAAPSDRVAFARRARSALAGAGDLRVQAWIENDLKDADADVRLGAAIALGSLGRSARAVTLLTDADASVRTRAACTIASSRR